MHEISLQTISVELRKIEAEQLESISGTSLVPNVANNILTVQHDIAKKAFAVIVENTTEILAEGKPTFSIKMAYLGIFSYKEKVTEKQFLELICKASETIYYAAIFQKIVDITSSFGIAPLRPYIASITPTQIANVHIEKMDLPSVAIPTAEEKTQ